MYIFSRVHSLTMAFARINVGDTPVKVMTVMGRPQNDTAANPGGAVAGNTEFRYSAWPAPQVWVVRFADGKVVSKEGATP